MLEINQSRDQIKISVLLKLTLKWETEDKYNQSVEYMPEGEKCH